MSEEVNSSIGWGFQTSAVVKRTEFAGQKVVLLCIPTELTKKEDIAILVHRCLMNAGRIELDMQAEDKEKLAAEYAQLKRMLEHNGSGLGFPKDEWAVAFEKFVEPLPAA